MMNILGISTQSIGTYFLMVAFFYVAIFGFTMADLRSGVKKAKMAGMFRSSVKYRETVNKLDRYYNMAIVLTLLDCVMCFSMACLGWSWYPLFPFATMFSAVGVGCIEIKSIFEKWEDKQKMEAKEVAAAIVKLYEDGKIEHLKELLTELGEKKNNNQ